MRIVAAGFVAAIALAITAPWGSAQNSGANDNGDVLMHLNAAINWYKSLTTKVPAGTEASDAIYLSNAEDYGAQVVRLAFQSARAQADLATQTSAGGNGATGGATSGPAQKYTQMENEVSQRIADDESQIAALKQKRPSGKNAGNVAAQQQSLEGKLALDKATLSAVQQLKAFVEQSAAGGTGLKGSINELARSVPEVLETQVNTKPGTATSAKPAVAAPRSGLLGQLVTLYEEMQSIRSIEQRLDENDSVQKIATDLRTPLRNALTNTFQQEKDLAAKAGVTRDQYDTLTERFKALSGALVPLSEEVLVLDQSRSNLLEWRKAHTNESRGTLIALLSRVAVILLAVGLVLGLAEIWRRLTFRYIHEPRRRRQFMVIRRFVMGFLIFLVTVMGFASEFSSLATFAGLLTAGIAVGLQTILLSVAAYFFVIGRYGISVGDRVSVAGVTGDVIDVGLVRFY